jgi:hypothetical protein
MMFAIFFNKTDYLDIYTNVHTQGLLIIVPHGKQYTYIYILIAIFIVL